MLEQVEHRRAAHALGNLEFAGLDRVARAEQPRHDVKGARAARNRARLLELPRDRARASSLPVTITVCGPGFGPGAHHKK